MKNKNNARTGGAVSPSTNDVDFINTGHAAQARYLAALANPFASPAVPIPDSFLEAHVSKMAKEVVLENVTMLVVNFYKVTEEATGDYKVMFEYFNGSWNTAQQAVSEVGARLVAGGISFEDVGRMDDYEGVITYQQINKATDGTPGSTETISTTERLSRNMGHGTVLYQPERRQALEFEGEAYTSMVIKFSAATDIIARYVVIAETDGVQGFTEQQTSNRDFVITSSYPNHHAGIFGDIALPALDHSLIQPNHTVVTNHNPVHHTTALQAAAHWVSSAAGWAWRHKDSIANLVKKAPSYYQAMTKYGGSVMSSSGRIMALGARAAPLALAL